MPNGANKKLNFIPKVWDSKHENEDGSNGAYVPIYIAPDATNSVQGDVFLSDSVNGTQDAENGMTAATPKAVAQVASSAKSYTDTVAAGKANTAHTHEMADVTGLSDAVKDAKKAGTDAASAASAAQSTADTAKANAATAQSTADRAQSSADAAQSTADDAWARTLRVQVSSAPADAAGDTSTLTATVWRGGELLSDETVAKMGLLAWYVAGKRVATGGTYTCAAGTAVECRLEA